MSLTEDESEPPAEDTQSYGRVGVTFGDVGTTSLKFNVSSPVNKGEYIQIAHPNIGWVLGQIDKIERQSDLSVDKAEELNDGKEVDIDDTVIAKVNIIGYRDEKDLLRVPGNPFRAGEPVYLAEEELIREVLGLKEDKEGAYIGKLRGHDIRVSMNINTIAQKHLSVLAKTGSGKSYTAGVLIEEMLKNDVTMVILDPHGEYSSIAKSGSPKSSENFDVEPRGYGEKLNEFSPNPDINPNCQPLKFTFRNMDTKEVLEMCGLNKRKTYISSLEDAKSKLAASHGEFTVSEIIRLLKNNEEGGSTTLIKGLERLKEKNIFAGKGTRMDELVNEGRASIVNLKGTPPDMQGFIVDKIARSIFELRKREKIPPLIMFAEEAHNFCPQRGKVECSDTFRTLASEGRKFGLGLGIITQRPAKVDKNVLSQCNTQIILKVTNPNDLKAIEKSVEGMTKGMKKEIKRLPVGEAILSGAGLSEPLLVQIRPRESKDGGESICVI
ncbi:MAG: ATP-binding protein [Candidatus Thermoplasmatota archaeon]|nr:ATP-binding protein [Candidatus Thermoplasmatota archaeon]